MMTDAELSTSPAEQMAQAIDRLNATSLQDVYREFGIDLPEEPRAMTWEAVAYEVDEALNVVAMTRNGESRRVMAAGQKPIGVPGTYVLDGRIEVEHNSRVRPYQARGRLGRPGRNEEVYRTEPVAFKSINEISALGENADYEPIIGETTPDNVRAEILRQHRAIRRALFAGDVLSGAMSGLLKHGWAFFEVGWRPNRDEGKAPRPTVDYIDFREQAAVERWIFDERQAKHVATEFRTTGSSRGYVPPNMPKGEVPTGDTTHYLIPNGDTLATARTMLVNIFASGLNLEGVSPLRVVIGIRKLKELILTAYGVGFSKYAVPIATIVRELTDASAAIIAQIGAADHAGELQTLITRLENLRGRLGAVLPIAPGYRLEFQNPSNDMVDPTPVLHYLDAMIALVFANEGALLGLQSFGSYAMAATSDSKFYRSAVVYSGRIARSLTQLLHTGLRLNGVDLDSLDELPRYSFRFNGTQDASRWLADLAMTMNAMKATAPWPDEVLSAVAAKFGLPLDVFLGMFETEPAESASEYLASLTAPDAE